MWILDDISDILYDLFNVFIRHDMLDKPDKPQSFENINGLNGAEFGGPMILSAQVEAYIDLCITLSNFRKQKKTRFYWNYPYGFVCICIGKHWVLSILTLLHLIKSCLKWKNHKNRLSQTKYMKRCCSFVGFIGQWALKDFVHSIRRSWKSKLLRKCPQIWWLLDARPSPKPV